MSYYPPLLPDRYYHIYNRGINSENIFREAQNYTFFLKKYAFYVEPIANTYAYCLLKNHFHLLVQPDSAKIEVALSAKNKPQYNPETLISRQFASFFSSYAQAFNKMYARTGGLFEEPFERKWIDSEAYFSEMIRYIHFNPQKHGFVADFRDYPHSSYHSFLLNKASRLKRNEVLEWFGGVNEFKQNHLTDIDERKIKDYLIEF